MKLDENLCDLTRNLGRPMSGGMGGLTVFSCQTTLGPSEPFFANKYAVNMTPHAYTHIDLPSSIDEPGYGEHRGEWFRRAHTWLEEFGKTVQYSSTYIADVSDFRQGVLKRYAKSPPALHRHGLMPVNLERSDYAEMLTELKINAQWMRERLGDMEDGSALLLYSGCGEEFSSLPSPHIASHPGFRCWHISFLHPYLSYGAIRFLQSKKIALVGIDAFGLDPFALFMEPELGFRPAIFPEHAGQVQLAHKIFLGNDPPVRMVEGWECLSVELSNTIRERHVIRGQLLAIPLKLNIILDAVLVKLLFRPDKGDEDARR